MFKTSGGPQNKAYGFAFYPPYPVTIQVFVVCRTDQIEHEFLVLAFVLHVFAAKKYFPLRFGHLRLAQLTFGSISLLKMIIRMACTYLFQWTMH